MNKLLHEVKSFIMRNSESSITVSLVAFALVVVGVGVLFVSGSGLQKPVVSAANRLTAPVFVSGTVVSGKNNLPFSVESSVLVQSNAGPGVASARLQSSGSYTVSGVQVYRNSDTEFTFRFNIPNCTTLPYRVTVPAKNIARITNQNFAISCVGATGTGTGLKK